MAIRAPARLHRFSSVALARGITNTLSSRASASTSTTFITPRSSAPCSTCSTWRAWRCCAVRRERCSARTRSAVQCVSSRRNLRAMAVASWNSTVGDFDRHEVRGMLDVPLIDETLLLRVAGQWREKDGYVDQLDFACVHPNLGGVVNPDAPQLPLLSPQRPPGSDCKLGSFGDERVSSARAALRWVPSNTVTVDLVGDWTDDDSNAGAQSLIAVNTDASDPNNPQSPQYTPFGGFNGNVAIPIYGIPYDERFLTEANSARSRACRTWCMWDLAPISRRPRSLASRRVRTRARWKRTGLPPR